MSWRILHIKDSEYLRLKLDNLEICKNDEKIYVPLSDISVIILEGQQTVITTRLLSKCSQYNIAIVICDMRYLPVGLYLSYGTYHRTAKRALQQLNISSLLKDQLWQYIVYQKTDNQIQFADYYGVEEDYLSQMKEMQQEITLGDNTNREGHIAKLYFNSLYGVQFSRDDEIIENMAMNFGYTIIRSCLARLVVGNGLMSMVGICHKNEFNQYNLVDDLMEPFRALLDYWIHEFVIDDDEDYLTYEKRLKIIDFMNQPMLDQGRMSTVDNVMDKYVKSFIKAIESNDVSQLKAIRLKDFMEARVNGK